MMDENPRFSEVLNLSELRSILYFVPSPPFLERAHRQCNQEYVDNIYKAVRVHVRVHIATIQIEGKRLKRANKWGGGVHN